MSNIDSEIEALRRQLDECKKTIASTPAACAPQPNDFLGRVCAPLHIVLAVAIPVLIVLILSVLQPGFVKVESGDQLVVSRWAIFKYTLMGSVVGWAGLAGWIAYSLGLFGRR